VKVIRFGVSPMAVMVVSFLATFQRGHSESLVMWQAAIASPGLLHLFHTSTLIANPPQVSETSSDIPLPDGKGRDKAKAVCGTCHGTDIWAKQHHTRDEWGAVIDSMTSRGMKASDADLDTVLDYLSAHFAPKKDNPPPSEQPQ
jgi:hypothetical protein